MSTFSDRCAQRRNGNASALGAFGAVQRSGNSPDEALPSCFREVRSGNGTTVFTIGYEGRDGEDLVSGLLNAGIEVLVDVRERPLSRRPDFRKNALNERCNDAGIAYETWTRLGSTGHQREQLRETGNLSEFRRRFRDFARRQRSDTLDQLAVLAKKKQIALICYERVHEECHRSIVADLIADRINATIVAIS